MHQVDTHTRARARTHTHTHKHLVRPRGLQTAFFLALEARVANTAKMRHYGSIRHHETATAGIMA